MLVFSGIVLPITTPSRPDSYTAVNLLDTFANSAVTAAFSVQVPEPAPVYSTLSRTYSQSLNVILAVRPPSSLSAVVK